ncbi:MAG TPA: YggT family protein [Marinospirillum sp.]|uniref:YggT family protein n=1 Tax=Marinospirillum sp. TaxID=2183934 RepID=UPI002B459CB7|nr:YggT family protein [Marinospirillum sp.]HKM14572.1 YggT family protein [Marinospirillum sp.]
MGMGAGLASFVQLLFSLATFVIVLRFLLHLSKADYFNPITQGVVKATNPIILPLQGLLKPMGRLDLASLLIAIVVKSIGITVALYLTNFLGAANLVSILIGGVTGVLKTVLDLYFFVLVISIVLSWVAPQANHPGAVLVYQLTEPLMAPVRKIIPNLGGLDLSPIFVFLGINLASSLLVGILAQLAGQPVAQFIGL